MHTHTHTHMCTHANTCTHAHTHTHARTHAHTHTLTWLTQDVQQKVANLPIVPLTVFQVLLPFSRDTVVLKHFSHNSATPPKSYIRGKLGVDEFSVIYPPNGVIPFHGFAMYGVYVFT